MTALVVVGASLGGVELLSALLSALPADFPAAVAIVQHRRAEEGSRLVEFLAKRSQLLVIEPEDRQPLLSGTVYLGPADYHLLVDEHALCLSLDEAVNFARPSIDVLFQSAAEAHIERLVGVLLSASSEDGARGLEAIARAGGRTIVQDPKQAKSAVAIEAALARFTVDEILPSEEIPAALVRAVGETPVGPGFSLRRVAP